MLDAVAPAVMIGQIIGRWGNFCNGEAHGSVIPEGSPLYFIRMGLSTHNISSIKGMAYVHPTFLYESVWNLIGFVIIHFLYKKKKFDGQIVLMYLTWYGFGRMFIESLRTDQLKIGVFPVSIVIGATCFVLGSILLIINFIKARRNTITSGEYAPTYAKISHWGETESATVAEATEVETVANNVPTEEAPTENDTDQQHTAEGAQKDDIIKRFSELLGDDDTNKENKGE